MKKESRAPLIIALSLLILPALYVASYFALVQPQYAVPARVITVLQDWRPAIEEDHYRYGGKFAARFYWPLEQIDRKLRPGVWADNYERVGVDFN